MVMTLTSLLLLLSGFAVATASPRSGAAAGTRAELFGGGLLATGLVLIGVGLQASFE